MGYIETNRVLFTKLLNMLEMQFGSNSEIVLHDLTRPYESTIVDIRNGHVTGRKIGDGGSNLGLEVLRGSVKDGDRYNYVTRLKSSRILRSSSTYFFDEEENVIAALCVNTDITEDVRYEEYLRQKNEPASEARQTIPEEGEFFPENVQDLLTHLIQGAQKSVNVPVGDMDRNEKIQFIRFLDEKGAFLITKSSELVCSYLDISKFSLYRYLEIIRGGDPAE